MPSTRIPDPAAHSDKRHRVAELAGWVQGLYPSGQEPVLVGGAAVELYASPALTTGDLDWVGDVPDAVARALTSAGFEHHGREWFHEEGRAILEFRPGGLAPGEGAAAVRAGGRDILCLGREELIVNRLASWATWASPIDGMNAYLLMVRPKAPADPARLDALARARNVGAALASLRALVTRKPGKEDLERWAVGGAVPGRPEKHRPGAPPPPRRRRPRAYPKWAALRRWGMLPPWEEFSAGYLLREARERGRLTQADLAERLGVSQQAIAQAERWRANPTAHFMRAWAEACGQGLTLEFLNPGGGREALCSPG